jgi:hypothetical protein
MVEEGRGTSGGDISLVRVESQTWWLSRWSAPGFSILGLLSLLGVSRAVKQEKRMSEHVARNVAIERGQYPGEAKKLRRESAVGLRM